MTDQTRPTSIESMTLLQAENNALKLYIVYLEAALGEALDTLENLSEPADAESE